MDKFDQLLKKIQEGKIITSADLPDNKDSAIKTSYLQPGKELTDKPPTPNKQRPMTAIKPK